ncbi:TetR/AcrR family transcriptional regulator [Streptomyces albireticuli]|uniref:TetR family transcriptional regulator n=1 Tax=Streptomyces albireticuli TaxID=1940 RepID=A0A2A2D6G8_9ACTN|nr:TetR family transcriptional regulator [Streptomyces albireticuli]MCD9195150.1 TetR family transcriptional regulator [Streptomyces albireticuli]PAU47036.1 TetR family transcriptional regulator [Streptomyces albireticuli]
MVSRSQPTRARSPEAKRAREAAILDAAARLATVNGIRAVTLTDIAAEVGLHKSAMLRYFETREEIFLRLAAAGWVEWSREVRERLAALAPGAGGGDGGDSAHAANGADPEPGPRAAAGLLAETLVARPLFCDLLAHTPMTLEHNVSLDSVRSFKVIAIAEVVAVGEALRRVVALTPAQAGDVVATATAMAGALWQMAAPGTALRRLYESDPDLAHAVVDVAPRLTGILSALLRGYGADGAGRPADQVE